MNHGSLFSGIGGFDLAAEWVGWTNIFQVEWDKYCQKVLEKNFPNVIRYGDIKEFDGTQYRGTIDILSAGVPCQPASLAGKRKGEKDDRWLWPETIRIFGEIKPTYAFFENPSALLSLDDGKTFERICCEMENIGYAIQTVDIPACFVGAWHKRQRAFIVADIKGFGIGGLSIQQWRQDQDENININGIDKVASDIDSKRLSKSTCTGIGGIRKKEGAFKGSAIDRTITENGEYWEIEPRVVRMVYGISNRVDRLKALGNAIVPQVAYEIFKIIDEIDERRIHEPE